MPSPDVRPYIQLSLIDQNPQDVFESAIAELRANFPDWTPREGNMEVLLLEAMALQVAEAVFAINRLPSAITEVLLSLYDIVRDVGEAPTASIRFEMNGTQGYSIPAGVSVTLPLPSGLEPLTFITENELVIPPGQSVGVVDGIGNRYTDEANDVQAETLLELQDSLIYVNYVRLDSDVYGGRQPETDIDYLSRAASRFQRLSSTLVLPSHFVSAALEDSRIERAFALDNYNPDVDPNGNGPIGNDGGHITLALYGNNEPINPDDKNDFLAKIAPSTMVSLAVHIIDPTITPISVSAKIAFAPGVDAQSVIDEVNFAIADYLNPMTWEWGTIVRRSSLISLISNVPGVDYLVELSVPATDVTLTGVANLVDSGTITIAGPDIDV
jgi:uncharacterized phage protein gp47/JayE